MRKRPWGARDKRMNANQLNIAPLLLQLILGLRKRYLLGEEKKHIILICTCTTFSLELLICELRIASKKFI